MTDYNGLIMNAASGGCLSAPSSGKDGDQMMVLPCNPADGKQTIKITNATSTSPSSEVKHQLYTTYTNGNVGQIDTWKGNVMWSGQCGSGNDCDFHVLSYLDNTNGLTSGPFKFQGWGRQGGNQASYWANNQTVTQTVAADGTPAATWVTYPNALLCQKYGVPLSECTQDQATPSPDSDTCLKYNHYLNANLCPTANQCQALNIPLDSTCTTKAIYLAKQCQALNITDTCTQDSVNALMSTCYNMGICSDASCNATAGAGGCTAANVKTWQDTCTSNKISPCNIASVQTASASAATQTAAAAQTAANNAALASVAAALTASTANTAASSDAAIATTVASNSPANLNAVLIGGGASCCCVLVLMFIFIFLM